MKDVPNNHKIDVTVLGDECFDFSLRVYRNVFKSRIAAGGNHPVSL